MSSPAALEELDWHRKAMAAVRAQAKKGEPFDAFTLTEAGLPNPPHPNQWGAVFSAASNAKLIDYVGHHKSGRPGRSGGVCALWVGRRAA